MDEEYELNEMKTLIQMSLQHLTFEYAETCKYFKYNEFPEGDGCGEIGGLCGENRKFTTGTPKCPYFKKLIDAGSKAMFEVHKNYAVDY